MMAEIRKNDLILAEGQYYSMDCFETQLNNNVLIVGAAGAGQTLCSILISLSARLGRYDTQSFMK